MSCVGFLLKTYPKLSETFILEEILGLERLGTALHVFSLHPPKDHITHDATKAVRAPVTYVSDRPRHVLRALIRRMLTHPVRVLHSALRTAFTPGYHLVDLARATVIADTMRTLRITHLHSHFINEPACVAHLVHCLTGASFSISAHAKDIYLSSKSNLAAKMKAARFTVTCTEYNRDHLAELAHDGSLVQRMYHGIDLDVFARRENFDADSQPLILAVGRLKPKKGFHHLIEACALLVQRGLPFRCEIVGYGEDETRLRARIRGLGLEERVQLVGKMNRTAILERYNAATVFAMPCIVTEDGDRDGIPNAALEAMAMELPVIATPISGIPEVIEHGRNGHLVPSGDASALAEALQALLLDPAMRLRLGKAARATVAGMFNNDRNLRKLQTLLEACTRAVDAGSGAVEQEIVHAD